MDANEIIGRLIAEPKYRFADKALIAEVVRDSIGLLLPAFNCHYCKHESDTIENDICIGCYYDYEKPNFELKI
jgi:hypothetical protein